MVWTHRAQYLKPKTEHIFLTEAAVPNKHRVLIEQDYFLLMKWQHRTEGKEEERERGREGERE